MHIPFPPLEPSQPHLVSRRAPAYFNRRAWGFRRYTAPLTAGNFVDLVDRGFYNNYKIQV